MAPLAKICGLSQADDARVAAENGADFLGFIHFEKSPRHVSLGAASLLGKALPAGPSRVGVMVDADDDTIEAFADHLALTHIQLHGRETVDRAAAIKALTGLKLIKVIKVAEREDISQADAFADIADMLLFDTKPLPSDTLPGGNARSFPWHYLAERIFAVPALVAGGLTPENVGEALAQSKVSGVDVSSGVESAPGVKSHDKIKAFLKATKAAS